MTKKITFPPAASRRLGVFMDEAARQSRAEEWRNEDHEKLLSLCRTYGIQPGPAMFYALALELARELYPEPKKRGRKTKWTELNQGALVVEVERLAAHEDPAHGVAWACQQLAKREPWASFLESKDDGLSAPDPAEALRKIYFDFCSNEWAKVARSAFRWYEHEGAIDEWEAMVMDVVRNPHPK